MNFVTGSLGKARGQKFAFLGIQGCWVVQQADQIGFKALDHTRRTIAVHPLESAKRVPSVSYDKLSLYDDFHAELANKLH